MYRDYAKWREENEIINIMRNCLYEVKRDVLLKKANSGKFSAYSASTNLITQPGGILGDNNKIMKLDEMALEEKYELVKNLMGHSYILDRLKDVIDQEIGRSDKYSFYHGKRIQRDISGLNSVRIQSANISNGGSGKNTGRRSYQPPMRKSNSRSKRSLA